MVIAIIAAAGQGTRLGADLPKAYVELAGQTLMERSVRAMIDAGVDHIIVVIMPAMEETARRILADYPDVQLVHGAGERVDSVWLGIQAIPTNDDDAVVLIHDSARALTPPDMIRRVAQAVTGDVQAVIPVLPVADTIKRVADTVVVDTPRAPTCGSCKPPRPSGSGPSARPIKHIFGTRVLSSPTTPASSNTSTSRCIACPGTRSP